MQESGGGAIEPESAISLDRLSERFECFGLRHKALIDDDLAGFIAPPAVHFLNGADVSCYVLQRYLNSVELY